MQELNSEKSDIESKILDIKHKLNNSTDFTYEQQIYPENTNNNAQYYPTLSTYTLGLSLKF